MSSERVKLPWIEEPMPVDEAVEALARTVEEDSAEWEALREDLEATTGDDGGANANDLGERVAALERRIAALERGTDVECPECGQTEDVLKSGVAAAKFAQQGRLSDSNVDALNAESHICLACERAFTPGDEETQ